jgi:hypothetical protein
LVKSYASIIRANINPAIGNVRMVKLQPITISSAYSAALARLGAAHCAPCASNTELGAQTGRALAAVAVQSMRRLRSAKGGI